MYWKLLLPIEGESLSNLTLSSFNAEEWVSLSLR